MPAFAHGHLPGVVWIESKPLAIEFKAGESAQHYTPDLRIPMTDSPRKHSYWNLRVIEFDAGEDSYSAVHEVYYEADGRLRGYSVDPAIMMWTRDDEPGAALSALGKF